jgi:hypothetical protein
MFKITHKEEGEVISVNVYNTLEEANIAQSEIIKDATVDTIVEKKEVKEYEIVPESVCETGNCPVKIKEVVETPTKNKAKKADK